MDPQVVGEFLNSVKDTVVEYGGLLFSIVSQGVHFIIYFVTGIPSWIMDVWYFVKAMWDVVMSQLGLK